MGNPVVIAVIGDRGSGLRRLQSPRLGTSQGHRQLDRSQPGLLYGLGGKQLPNDDRAPQALLDARNAIYATTEPSLPYVSLSGFDTYERDDLARLSLPVTRTAAPAP